MINSPRDTRLDQQRIESVPSLVLTEHKNSWNEWNGIWSDVSYVLYGYDFPPDLGECLSGLFARPAIVKRLQHLYQRQPEIFDENSLIVLQTINACIDQFNILLEELKSRTWKCENAKKGDPGFEYDVLLIRLEERPALMAILLQMEQVIDEVRYLIFPELRPSSE